jgi:hypothetical protein
MEITADFDPGAAARHLERIERQMEDLRAQLPLEFAEWQTADMRRKRASVKQLNLSRGKSHLTRAATTVLPTSYYRFNKRRLAARRRKKRGVEASHIGSNRPVLRQVLIDRFHERFDALLDRAFS